MAELWLVCEGEPASVDVAILKPVFATVLAAEIVVEPAGGKKQAKVVAQFLKNQRGGTAAYVSDRDYSPGIDAEVAFGDGKPGFLWRRHSIENYLLSPQIILRAFRRLRERIEQQHPDRVPSWFADLPVAPEQFAQVLRECASKRAAEEACRIANHRLWATLPSSVGQVQKRNPSTPSTDDPSEPNRWRQALCQEVERVCSAAAQTAVCPQFRRENVTLLFDSTYAEVTANPYVTEMEFLIDFHGRDLLKELHRWLFSRGVRLTFDQLRGELIPAVVQEYERNRMLYGQDDFRDLANGVRSLAGLAPLA